MDPSRLYSISYLHKSPEVHNATSREGKVMGFGARLWLLELSADILFDERVQPVCLASNDHQLVHPPFNLSSDAWVAGWRRVEGRKGWSLERRAMTQVQHRRVSLQDPPVTYSSEQNHAHAYVSELEQESTCFIFAQLSTWMDRPW